MMWKKYVERPYAKPTIRPTQADIPIITAIRKAANIAKKTIVAGPSMIDCTVSTARLIICAGYLILI